MTRMPSNPLRTTVLTACVALLAACQSGSGDAAVPPEAANCNSATEYCGVIPVSADACTDNQYWPLVLQSSLRPLTVHYSKVSDAALAAQMVSILETAWTVQVEELGFTEPLDDNGACGSDGRYDVFIWRGIDGAFVDGVADNPATPYDDYSTYMAISPTGAYGGAFLDSTLTHEFNHALQASDDWWESAMFYEMSATFVEALVYPDQSDYFYTTTDFQLHPDWSLFYDDNFRTWYMYGAAMYLHFIRERYFQSDPGFIARIWHESRSDPADGRPDFLDAIRTVLVNDRGVDLDSTFVEFMQWRWFVAEFDDGTHFENGAVWPTPVSYTDVDASAPLTLIDLRAMLYGGNYLRIRNNSPSDRQFSVDLQSNDNNIIWSLTSVAGDEISGSVTVPAMASTVLVATVVPAVPVNSGTLDFDRRNAVVSLQAL
jgi:hypothetical protein